MGGAQAHLRATVASMVRRLIVEEPPSRLAGWSQWLALFALVVALLAVIIVRGNLVEAVPGFVVLASALVLAILAILMAVGAFVVIWRNGNPGFGRAFAAFVLGGLMVAYPAYIASRNFRAPAISDITTDTSDPPRFEAIARVRPRDANSIVYPGAQAAERQRAAYPEIVPLQTPAAPDEAYAAALEVLNGRKWSVIDARTPQAGRRDGRIEAVALTPIMGFRDDVVVRVRPSGSGARVDIRSASRYGRLDFGSNARRIRSLLDEIEETVGAQPAASR
jgi:uncharacterized protein (DUF1499 family)